MPWISNCTTSVIFALAAQTLEPGHHPAPGSRIFKRNSAGVYPGLRDRMTDHREARDVHVIRDQQVAADGAGTADLATLPDHRAAGYSRTTGDGRMGPQAHVVTDLDQVIKLHPIPDHRVT